MSELRLFIIADDPLARAGLAALMNSQEGCLVIGQGDSRDILSDVDEYFEDTDVIVWDFGWENGEGVSNWQELNMPIVGLVGEDTAASNLWASGLRTILNRDSNAEMILITAQAALNELVVLAPSFVDLLHLNRDNEFETIPDLTHREKEVLQLVAEGMTNKAIAHQLSISDHTVKFHINAFMSKLNAQSRTEAVVKATRMGLILL